MFNKYNVLLVIRLGITGFKFLFFLLLANILQDEDIALIFFFHAGISVFSQIITFDIYIPFLQKFNHSNNIRFKIFILKNHFLLFLIRSTCSLILLSAIYFLFINEFPEYFSSDIFFYFIIVLFLDSLINDILRYLQVFDVVGQAVVMSLRNFVPYFLFLIVPTSVEKLFLLIIFFGFLSFLYGTYRLLPSCILTVFSLRTVKMFNFYGFLSYFKVVFLRSLYFNIDRFILAFFLEPSLYARYSFYSTIGQVFHLVVQTLMVQPRLKFWFKKEGINITPIDVLKSILLSIFILIFFSFCYFVLRDHIVIYELGILGIMVMLGYAIGSATVFVGAYTYCKYSFNGLYTLHKVGCLSFIISIISCFLLDFVVYYPFVFYLIFTTFYLIYSIIIFDIFARGKEA